MTSHDSIPTQRFEAYSHVESATAARLPPNVVMPVRLNFLLRRKIQDSWYATNTAYRSHMYNHEELITINGDDMWPLILKGTQSWQHVYLTNPPVKKAKIQFNWTVGQDATGYVYRHVEQEEGLTLDVVLGAALDTHDPKETQRKGDSSWSVVYEGLSITTLKEVTLREALSRFEKKYHYTAKVQNTSWIFLPGVAAPTEAEWRQMK